MFEQSLNYVDLWYAHSKTEKWILTQVPEQPPPPSPLPVKRPFPSCERLLTRCLPPVPSLPVRPYSTRGWTCFERALAEFLADQYGQSSVIIVADITLLSDETAGWDAILTHYGMQSRPPLAPELFNIDFASKSFTSSSDVSILQQRYSDTFEVVVASAEQLAYRNLSR